MKIALVQMNATMGHFESTLKRILAHDQAMAKRGADLVVYPSTVVTGYDPLALLGEKGFQADIAAMLEELAASCTVPTVLPFTFGLMDAPVSEAALIMGGQVIPLRSASLFAHLGQADLGPLVHPVVKFVLGDVDFGVCFNLSMLEAYTKGDQDADIVLYLPFEGYNTDDEYSGMATAVSDGFYLREAAEANCWLVAVNGAGAQDQIVFSGGSFVLAPWGELACVLPSFEEAVDVCDIDVFSEGPLAHPALPPMYNRMVALWRALALATNNFVVKQGKGGVTVLLTGDLMSSALAALAVDALGPTRVHGVIAPVSGARAAADARMLASNLRMSTTEITAEDLDCASNALGLTFRAAALKLARVRANAFSETQGYLSLTSADKTALAVGQDPDCFSACDFAPFSDVYRSDLLALVSNRNLMSPVIPRSAANRVDIPQDLRLDKHERSDSLVLSDLDSILLRHIERGESLTDLVLDGCDELLAQSVIGRYDASELERRTCPVGPVLSDCALAEHRMPICCAWHDRIRDEAELAQLTRDTDSTVYPESLMERFLHDLDEKPSGEVVEIHPTNIGDYLRDFASTGGMRADGDDMLGSGLFSKN